MMQSLKIMLPHILYRIGQSSQVFLSQLSRQVIFIIPSFSCPNSFDTALNVSYTRAVDTSL